MFEASVYEPMACAQGFDAGVRGKTELLHVTKTNCIEVNDYLVPRPHHCSQGLEPSPHVNELKR